MVGSVHIKGLLALGTLKKTSDQITCKRMGMLLQIFSTSMVSWQVLPVSVCQISLREG